MHVSYKTHIASLYYIKNFSTYVVSRRSRSTNFVAFWNVMEFSINIARSKGQKVKVKPVFPRNVSSCMSLFGIVLHATRVLYVRTGSNRFKPVQTGSNRMKPGKTQEKSAPSAVVAGYINRAATAIAITTVLRSLQSTYYILYIIFVCTKLIHRNHNRSPIFAHLYRRITSNDEIHMFKMQQSVCKKLPFTSPYKNGM